MSKIDTLFDAVESKSHIMFTEKEEMARLQYLVGFYKSKIREVHHELEIMNKEIAELVSQIDLLNKEV